MKLKDIFSQNTNKIGWLKTFKKLGADNEVLKKLSKEIDDAGNNTGGSDNIIRNIKFYDYDGTILYQYSKEEFLSLSEMPPLPTREGLICQEWNWDYEDVLNVLEKQDHLDIGATYITDDGKTRIYITVYEDNVDSSIQLEIKTENDVKVCYGDGQEEIITNTGIKSILHTYNKGKHPLCQY